MRSIGLFGGSFDPPHAGHQLVARYALESLDELWWIPVLAHPRGKQLAPFDDRVAMCELAVAAFGPRACVSRAEEQLGPCHTIAVLDHLTAIHPETTFHLVVGADLLEHAPSWERWDEIVARAPPITVGRGSHTVPGAPSMPDISSTEIRARLAAGATDLAGVMSRSVLAYIATRALYSA